MATSQYPLPQFYADFYRPGFRTGHDLARHPRFARVEITRLPSAVSRPVLAAGTGSASGPGLRCKTDCVRFAFSPKRNRGRLSRPLALIGTTAPSSRRRALSAPRRCGSEAAEKPVEHVPARHRHAHPIEPRQAPGRTRIDCAARIVALSGARDQAGRRPGRWLMMASLATSAASTAASYSPHR